ncbi:MAG: ferrous iron transport protein A [Clostridia bacterium]|nr:ferrous iron transport protein A [Clostridia bacterium]
MSVFLFGRNKKPTAANTGNSVFDLKCGECAKIKRITVEGSAKTRLDSLGVTVGKRVTVLSFSLFKSGVLIGCGAVRLGVRKALARQIEVELCA